MKKNIFLLLVCFCAFFCEAQNFEWAFQLGGAGYDTYQIAGSDRNGNFYGAGLFTGTVDFDPGAGVFNLTATGSDMILNKLDSSGNFIWAKKFTGGGFSCQSIKVDSALNIFVVGGFAGTADFDPGPGTFFLSSSGGNDAFILKLDANGNFLWARKAGASVNSDEFMDIDIDKNGTIYLVGTFVGTVDFDLGAGINNLISSGRDGFILKVDSVLNFVWIKKIGGSSTDNLQQIELDDNGNIYVSGSVSATADLDPGAGVFNVTAFGGTDNFVSKFDTSGNFIWCRQFGTIYTDWGIKIANDSTGIVGAGYFEDTLFIDPNNANIKLNSAGAQDIFVFRLNSNGNFVWQKRIGGQQSDFCYSMDLDLTGNVYFNGIFQNTVDFDPGFGIYNLVAGGSNDGYLCKLDYLGNFIWGGQFKAAFGSWVSYPSLVATGSNDIYSIGSFAGTADIDITSGISNFTSLGSDDAFVTRISQDLCANKSLVVDSVSSISCINLLGYASSHISGPLSPHTFQWNTIPVTNDSIAYFNMGGIFTVTYSDMDNCIIQSSILVGHGPTFFNGFDLNANLFTTDFRPGTSSTIFIDGFNNGCDSISGSLKIVLDSMVTYYSSSPPPFAIISDTMIWNYNNIYFNSSHVTPQIFVQTSTSAQAGDTVCFDIYMTPISGDAYASNNIKKYCFEVNNGYDPNIKSVYPIGVCPEHFVLSNQKLTYTVKFQNTGNSNAINIFVLDSLDADLDLSSVRVIASSHSLITEVLPGNVLKFRFDNIMLPDSASNEPASHGYVIYEVDPLPGATDGTEIKNHADIYFDFNPPVITNTTLNTLVSVIPNCTIATEITESDESGFKIYPNPAEDVFFVDNIQVNSAVYLYDISGRLILAQKSNSSKCAVNTSSLQNGIYLVEVGSGGLSNFQRIVINR